ncbi:MAG: hypothetical protein ISS70_24320 [Phycisphaerae bacterium]|jgi:hypothetical protein|nr:hypothetical protein [Phycisphaerae bacterium]
MEVGSVVKIRFKRFFKEQRLWIFIGKVMESNNNWLKIYGKGILFNCGKTNPIDIDDEARTLYCPMGSINYIRLLPDDFDLTDIKTLRKDNRWYVEIEGHPNTSLGEGL